MARVEDRTERARIVGDSRRHTVLLPAGRGFGDRTLLAKTCTDCGHLLDAAHFPPTGRNRTPGTRCTPCEATWQSGYYWRRDRDAMRSREAGQQADSLRTATERGQRWTPAHLAVALRKDLTALEAASQLGRTQASIHRIRRRARTEPRLAGLSQAAS